MCLSQLWGPQVGQQGAGRAGLPLKAPGRGWPQPWPGLCPRHSASAPVCTRRCPGAGVCFSSSYAGALTGQVGARPQSGMTSSGPGLQHICEDPISEPVTFTVTRGLDLEMCLSGAPPISAQRPRGCWDRCLRSLRCHCHRRRRGNGSVRTPVLGTFGRGQRRGGGQQARCSLQVNRRKARGPGQCGLEERGVRAPRRRVASAVCVPTGNGFTFSVGPGVPVRS